MQFKPQLMALIREGIKTQARRPVWKGDTAVTDALGKVFQVVRKGCVRWAVGKVCRLQHGHGQPTVARIKVTAIRQERLGDITQADALAEGFASREAFFAYWDSLHGRLDLNQSVWVLSFQFVN